MNAQEASDLIDLVEKVLKAVPLGAPAQSILTQIEPLHFHGFMGFVTNPSADTSGQPATPPEPNAPGLSVPPVTGPARNPAGGLTSEQYHQIYPPER